MAGRRFGASACEPDALPPPPSGALTELPQIPHPPCKCPSAPQVACVAERTDFSIETTLSGRCWNRFLDALDDADYVTTIYYLGVPNPELCVARVRTRVAIGGHGVPDADIRRRFVSGAWI